MELSAPGERLLSCKPFPMRCWTHKAGTHAPLQTKSATVCNAVVVALLSYTESLVLLSCNEIRRVWSLKKQTRTVHQSGASSCCGVPYGCCMEDVAVNTDPTSQALQETSEGLDRLLRRLGTDDRRPP